VSVDAAKPKEGNVSEMEIVQIQVKDLVIDLPVSDTNVAQKKASLGGVGMVQPITVWKNGDQYRIIDGFHRVAAAGLLGWDTVPSVVRDCSEEAFWDARIQSAKQHSDISEERLRAWIGECWRASKWGVPRFPAHKPGTESVLQALCESGLYKNALWLSNGNEPQTPEQRSLDAWLQLRAAGWGVSKFHILDCIIKEFLTPYEIRYLARGLNLAARADIRDAAEVLEVIRAHDDGTRQGRDIRQDDVNAWRDQPPESRPSLVTFIDERLEEKARASEERRKLAYATEVARRKAAEEECRQRVEAYRQTPEYRAQKQQEVRRLLMARYDALDAFIDENASTLAEMPDGPDLLAAQAEWALQKIAEMWPGAERDDVRVPAILSENVRLRAELAKEHDARLKAEGAMASMAGSTERITQRRPDVMAWSSAIVEGLA